MIKEFSIRVFCHDQRISEFFIWMKLYVEKNRQKFCGGVWSMLDVFSKYTLFLMDRCYRMTSKKDVGNFCGVMHMVCFILKIQVKSER